MATGQMFLPQTDVILPGRSAAGLHPPGRIRIPHGLVVRPDLGLHHRPAPRDRRARASSSSPRTACCLPIRTPTGRTRTSCPEAGPRWPLTRLDAGGYRVDDPITGQSRHFSPPRDGLGRSWSESPTATTTRSPSTTTPRHPLAIRHSGGYHLTLTTDGRPGHRPRPGRRRPRTAPTSPQRYGYTDGNLTTVTNSSGLPLQFTYDERRRVIVVDRHQRQPLRLHLRRRGPVHRRGRRGGPHHPHPRLRRPRPRRPATASPPSPPPTAAPPATDRRRCQVVAEIDPLGRTVRTAYDGGQPPHLVRRIARAHHARSSTTRRASPSRSSGRTAADRTASTYSGLAVGPPPSTAGRHLLARTTYDDTGQPHRRHRPGGPDHPVRLRRRRVTSPPSPTRSAHVTTVRCDAAGLPVRITDPLGAVHPYERDAFGRPVTHHRSPRRATHLAWWTSRAGWPAAPPRRRGRVLDVRRRGQLHQPHRPARSASPASSTPTSTC